jgi:cell wall-associated NlpC family hydrolase
MPINGPALGALSIGSIFLYSALKGKSVLASAQAIITGKSPATVKPTLQITDSPPSTDTNSSTTLPSGNNSIVGIAMKSNGQHRYIYGAPPPIGKVDCSSWVSEVLGDAGLPIPGGTWAQMTHNGTEHGPTTISYLGWSGAKTIGHSPSDAQPNDLVVWQTHMGICIGPNQMISAQDEKLGIGTSTIHIPGELLFVRRLI